MLNNFRVIPVLLLQDGGLVKTKQFSSPTYIGDPVNAIRIFNDKEVDELVFLDIDASKANRPPDFDLLAEIASECFMPLGYGGGVSSMEHVERLFKIGLEKIIFNSVSFKNPNLITEVSKSVGNQSVVVSIDVTTNWRGKKKLYSHSEKKHYDENIVEFAKKMESLGAGEIILNSVKRDGIMGGYDIELIKEVSNNISIPLVACGGAGSLRDIKSVINNGDASAAAAGSFFVFHGPHKAVLINYPNPKKVRDILNAD